MRSFLYAVFVLTVAAGAVALASSFAAAGKVEGRCVEIGTCTDPDPLLTRGLVLLGVGATAWLLRLVLTTRPCPRCGARVPEGRLMCKKCDFDFRSVGARAGGD